MATRVQAWLLVIKPRTLVASVLPVLVGLAVVFFERGVLHWPAAVVTLVAACLIQIGTNLSNDVFDYRRGADTEERKGSPKPIQQGWLSERAVLVAAVAALGAAFLLGIYLVWFAGPWIVLIGLASLLCGWLYTAGPFPLAYHGLGDVFVMVFFGVLAVCGTVFVQTGRSSALALELSLPIGMLATAVLVANHVRDIETDTKANKRTLVVRFGRRFGVWEYTGLVWGAYVLLLLPWCVRQISFPVLLPWLTLPLSWPRVRDIWRLQGRDLRLAVGQTARLEMVFGLLLVVGVCLARMWRAG